MTPDPPDRHSPLGLSEADVVGVYRGMRLARRLDERVGELNRAGKAPAVISSRGLEAAQVGSASTLAAGTDTVVPHYRDLGVVLTVGMTPYEVMLGVFAKADDPSSGGRQMPMHWGSRRLGIVSGSSAIATHVPHAAGIAMAVRLRGDRDVVACYFGEAAASTGDFHEACTFAGDHRLPLVLVCENTGSADGAEQARAHGFPGVVADGGDALAVYAAAQAAVRRARRGEGPTLVDCRTYRRHDPVAQLRQYLIEHRLLPEAAEEELEAGVEAEIDDAVRRAGAAPDPAPASALVGVVGVGAVGGPERGVEGAPIRSVVEAVREVLRDHLAGDERAVVLGEGVGPRGGVFRATEGLHAEFGTERVVEAPGPSVVGIGVGLALAGMRPVVEVPFADFIHGAFDQLVGEAAKLRYRSNGDFAVPLVVRVPWGGGVHGGLYHSQAIEAFYAHVAGLKVVAPSTPADVAGLLRAAIDDPDPVVFLEHKKTYRLITGPVPADGWTVPIGAASVARPGSDVTVITYGLHRHLALEAAGTLAGEGLDVEVVDLRTISPLDRPTIVGSACRTGRVLVVHEDNVSFGVGAEVAAVVAEEAFYDLDAPVRRLAMPDVPAMPFAAPLERAVSIGAGEIAAAARSLAKE